MEMEFTRLEKIVGTFVVIVTVLLMTTLVIIGRGKDWFETYRTYYTTFNETYNLQENAAVKLFKADIGKVQRITLVNNRVRVKLLILDQYASRIRQDAIAVVESPTLIGSEYISILPGSQDAPRIEESGEIPSREKRSITDIMTEFEVEKTAKMVVKSIQDISKVTDQLGDPDGPLMSAIDNFNRVSLHIERITADLDAGKGPMGALLKSDELMRQMMRNVDLMAQILESIQTAAAKTPDAVESLDARIMEAGLLLQDIRRASASLQEIIADVKAGSVHVPRISTTFRDGVQEIREGVEQINRVVDSLQKNVFIRTNLPPNPLPEKTESGARP